MGLMGTLARVAIGYAAARGVDTLSGGQGLTALLGGKAQLPAQDPLARQQAQAGQMLSGTTAGDGAPANPLQDMMRRLRQATTGDPGALGGMGAMGGMAGMTGGANPLAGMMASMGATQGSAVGALLDAFNTGETGRETEEAAGLMLRAMIQAAKADGGIDAAEKARILDTVGADADAGDIAFVEAQLAAPVNAQALAADTPPAQRLQVYSASLMTIRVDTEAEAAYLDMLAKALELDEPTVNTLHMQMGLQPLYG